MSDWYVRFFYHNQTLVSYDIIFSDEVALVEPLLKLTESCKKSIPRFNEALFKSFYGAKADMPSMKLLMNL